MTTDPTLKRWRSWGVAAAVLGSQSLVAALPQPGNALMLLPSEGPVAGLGDGLRRGFSLAQEQARICGAPTTEWSVGWIKPGADLRKNLRYRVLPPLVLAPPAAPLVETGLLAEARQRQVLLPLQRGASLQQLASRPGSDRLWPVSPARSLQIDALVKALADENLKGFLLITDGSADQQQLADRFLESMRGQGGVLLGPDLQARTVNANKPDEVKLLVSDAEWFQPNALVIMTPNNSPLMKMLLEQPWPEAMRLVWNVPPVNSSPQVQIGVDAASRGPLWNNFEKAFEARFGYRPGPVEAAGFDTGQLVALSVSYKKLSPSKGMDAFQGSDPAKTLCQSLQQSALNKTSRPSGAASNLDLNAATPPTAQLDVIQKASDGKEKRKLYNLGAS
jgi:hypothetical protein